MSKAQSLETLFIEKVKHALDCVYVELFPELPAPVFRGAAPALKAIPKTAAKQWGDASGRLPAEGPSLGQRRELQSLRRQVRDSLGSELRLQGTLDSLGQALERLRGGDYTVRLGAPPIEDADQDATSDLAFRFDRLAEALENTVALNARFQSMAAHDMRSPLASIELALGGLRSMCDQPDQRRFVDLIQSAARRQLRMVESVLELYAIQAGRLNLDIRVVDLNRLLRQCVNALRPQAEARRQTIAFSPLSVESRICCDEAKIARVVDNLTGNAIKYSVEGDALQLACRWSGPETALVEVIDHGPGMEPEEQAVVFECFKRGAGSTGVRGTGLGLAICKDIVEAHGGRLWVESSLGAGCRFAFTLQRRSPAGARPPASGEA